MQKAYMKKKHWLQWKLQLAKYYLVSWGEYQNIQKTTKNRDTEVRLVSNESEEFFIIKLIIIKE